MDHEAVSHSSHPHTAMPSDHQGAAPEGMAEAADAAMHEGHMHSGALAAPGRDASTAEITQFLEALSSAPEMHMHEMGSPMIAEHMAVMDLVARGDATHVAIADGDWSDPSIWSGGQVPGTGAHVLIPEGVRVEYGTQSDVRLEAVRVDGVFDVSTTQSSQIIFDTFVVGHTGHLMAGTVARPVEPGVTIDFIVAQNGAIDTVWDPTLVSRGVISMGSVDIHGAAKDAHEKVSIDPMAGDTALRFDGTPEGWAVGDTLVIAGTRYDGYKWDNDIRAVRAFPNEDEVRTITAIDADGTVWLDRPLQHDHDTPRSDLKTSVANMTRNVTFETENADEVAVWERGHVMFMHSDEVDVRFAAFEGLGRTDKSGDSRETSDFGQISFESNVQGRYPLHLHRTGTEDLENPAILEGNAVFGSPGWGIVHHDANAVLRGNATFDTFGAGYVAETGNETGAWVDNIAIYARGQSWDAPKNQTNLATFDIARSGDGFWFQGRMVEAEDNIAASVNSGFVYFHRNGDDRMIPFSAALFEYPDALYNDPNITAHATPILSFEGNETFAAKEGLHVVKENPNQGHDVWSVMQDFTAWNVVNGAHLEYTSHYLLRNFDLLGKEDSGFSPALEGLSIGNNTSELIIADSDITGFNAGIDFWKSLNADVQGGPERHDYVALNVTIADGVDAFWNFDPNLDLIISSVDLPGLAPNLTLNPIIMGEGQWGATEISGTKTDTLGSVPFPGGTDAFQIGYEATIGHLQQNGFWRTSQGEAYFLLDIYFTDRVTGEIFFETHPVWIPEDTASSFGASWSAYQNVPENGVQDITGQGDEARAGDVELGRATQASESGDFSSAEPVPDGLTGTASDDVLVGTAAPDRLEGRGGDDVLDGAAGPDTAVFNGAPSQFTLTLGVDATTLTDRTGGDGTDRLENVEFLSFDTTIGGQAFDLMPFERAAALTAQDLTQLVELYIASFNRAPDAFGLAFWASARADGMQMTELARLFLDQPETRALYSTDLTATDFASAVYLNVLGRVADADGLAFWASALDSGGVTRDQFILAVLQGARADPPPLASQSFIEQQQADRAYLSQKTDVGAYFAVTFGMSDVAAARDVMELFDGSPAGTQQAVNAVFALSQEANAATTGEFLMPIVGVLPSPFEHSIGA
ncbi:MAG: DUF4214 domain-containing protein [Pseudomonadota bacterium]